MSDERPRIVFSIGDINGIGVEVLARALASPSIVGRIEPVVAGNGRLVREYLAAHPSLPSGPLLASRFIELPSDASLRFGHVDAAAGRLALDAIVAGTRAVLDGDADALVTMPISKEGLHAAGSDAPGHTELIASMTGGEPMMILMTRGMLVALATIHVPLHAVPALVTPELIASRLRQLDRALRVDFGAEAPRIAVLALNPHAGEGGSIGTEERDVIAPAVAAARNDGVAADGPFPADGYFARFDPDACDGILAMYHDQGLIPLKLFARGGGVNFTASLPIVRTSPDHGTAYAIAGRGVADERSTIEAISVALEVVQNRRRST